MVNGEWQPDSVHLEGIPVGFCLLDGFAFSLRVLTEAMSHDFKQAA